MKYVTFDYENEGTPGAYWHIYSTDRDKDSLADAVITITGPDTPEMKAAITAVCEALDKAVAIAESGKFTEPAE